MAKTMLTARCSHCGIEFERVAYEIMRAERLNRKVFCSRSCKSSATPPLPPYPKGKMPSHLRSANRRDEYSPFRMHLSSARAHSRQRSGESQECSITLKDLKEQWDKQQGICPYTGWVLDNPSSSKWGPNYPSHAARASLDRIDSSKGYVVGNVQFVAKIANFAKHGFDESVLFEFCKAVVEYRNLL
jgi:hypothetical protein